MYFLFQNITIFFHMHTSFRSSHILPEPYTDTQMHQSSNSILFINALMKWTLNNDSFFNILQIQINYSFLQSAPRFVESISNLAITPVKVAKFSLQRMLEAYRTMLNCKDRHLDKRTYVSTTNNFVALINLRKS